MKFLRRHGPDQFSYTLAHSKTNQTGQEKAGNVKPVEGVAGAALAAWLAASGVQEGPIFRQVRKGGIWGRHCRLRPCETL